MACYKLAMAFLHHGLLQQSTEWPSSSAKNSNARPCDGGVCQGHVRPETDQFRGLFASETPIRRTRSGSSARAPASQGRIGGYPTDQAAGGTATSQLRGAEPVGVRSGIWESVQTVGALRMPRGSPRMAQDEQIQARSYGGSGGRIDRGPSD